MRQNACTEYTPEQQDTADQLRPLVQAAGLDSEQHDAGNTYFLATAILHDRVVHERCLAATPKGSVWVPGALQIVQAMTPGELEALRLRIIRKHKPKVVQP